ncbi:DEKNAAC105223 [Brettanomyces naardenensis]|uniref:Large ribosomal subunit protein bL32m n=1 Tax=Brettanomyces naardenensis TaxID=13370 RepID=A0A448YSM6_BRENA|nr:DEKNAAC105223 [Brettanomyces naardenensis]
MSFAVRSGAGLISVGQSLLPRLSIPSLSIPLPSFLQPRQKQAEDVEKQEKLRQLAQELPNTRSGIPFFHDNGILLAAPKKKTSHMKRRQRLYAPGSKQIKLKNNLNRCPACGHYKRSHFLCMHCVSEIQQYWKQRDVKLQPEPFKEEFTNPQDEEVLYPGKTERMYERKLRRKEYLVKRPKTLPVEH